MDIIAQANIQELNKWVDRLNSVKDCHFLCSNCKIKIKDTIKSLRETIRGMENV